MYVKATQPGYYGGIYRESGSVFPLDKGEKPGTWMQKVDAPESEIEGEQQPVPEPDSGGAAKK